MALPYTLLSLLSKRAPEHELRWGTIYEGPCGSNYAYHRQTGGKKQGQTLCLLFCFISEYGIMGLDILSLRRALLICVLEEQSFRGSCTNSSSYLDI